MAISNPICFVPSSSALKALPKVLTVVYSKPPTPTQGQLWPRGTK